MLWSDRPEESSAEARAALVKLRRGGVLFAFLLPVALTAVVVWFP